jgi:hypothetical protein
LCVHAVERVGFAVTGRGDVAEKLPAPTLSSMPFAPLPERFDDEMPPVVPPSLTGASPLLLLAVIPDGERAARARDVDAVAAGVAG